MQISIYSFIINAKTRSKPTILSYPEKREGMKPGQAFDQHCRCKIERERLQWDQKVTIIFYTSARFYWCASFIARDVQICEGKTTKIVSPPFIGNLP